MKTKNGILPAVLLLTACGAAPDAGWKSSDLRCIPFFNGEDRAVYADTRRGTAWGDFGSAGLFYEDVAIVTDGDATFFVNRSGERLDERTYRDATVYDGGIAWTVEPGGPLVAVDKRGKTLFEFREAEAACAFHDGLAAFRDRNGLWGAVDRRGKVVVAPIWGAMGPMWVNGMIPVRDADTGLWGLADDDGNLSVDCRFEELATSDVKEGFTLNYVQALREGRIPVRDGDRWGVIDQRGNYLINPQFDAIVLDGGEYLFRKGNRWGWCDRNGQYRINPQFRDALPFAGEELAAVRDKQGEWGYVDREGSWAIEPQFRKAGRFLASGAAPVCDEQSRDWGLVDKKGKWVVNPQFGGLYDIGAEDMLLVVQSGCFGVIDTKGKYVVTPEYENAPAALERNVSGISLRYQAESDYVDVAAVAQTIGARLSELRTATAGELLQTYGLKESRFPKNGGDATLCNTSVTSDMKLKIVAAGVRAWDRKSDGWFGYDYTFRPEAQVTSYVTTVELQGKAARFADEIFAALARQYPSDGPEGTLNFPGSRATAFVVPGGGIVFHVKTGSGE